MTVDDGRNRSDKADERPPSALHVRPGVPREASARKPAADRPAPRRRELPTREYVDGVLAGDRGILARAITLVESNAPAHFEQAQEVVQTLLPHRRDAQRIGITGVPGAGKSTFVETLGTRLTAAGRRVAVTAVDPSSSVSGGSLLGDKTRMEQLAVDPAAFIRPSPSGGTLGGVTRKTRETILLFEAAGYDVILVETVGVGQSEALVRGMVDFFLLLLIAGAGDELQGLKRGVIELADAVVINKADGDGRSAAERTRSEYERALHYLRPATAGWTTPALACSALHGDGIEQVWQTITEFFRLARDSGSLEYRRREQERAWVHALVAERLQGLFRSHPRVRERLEDLEAAVVAGEITAVAAARELLTLFEAEAPPSGGSAAQQRSGPPER
jgi:LAO/AO transport system kinase